MKLFCIVTISQIVVTILLSLCRFYNVAAVLGIILAYQVMFNCSDLVIQLYILQMCINSMHDVTQGILIAIFGFSAEVEAHMMWKGIGLSLLAINSALTLGGFLTAYNLLKSRECEHA